MEKRKVRTGIEGLDGLIEGGFVEGRTCLVAGETGTGKTTFSLQYLLYGANEGENGVYVTIHEKPEHIIEDAMSIGWDLNKLIEENKLLFVELTPHFYNIEKIDAQQIVDILNGYINEINAKRLVIDPIAPLVTRSDEPLKYLHAQMYIRNYIRRLFYSLDDLKVTTVVTSEIPTGTNKLSRYGIEEFLASGVIVLRLQMNETGFRRELYIRKMKSVNHSMNVYSFVIQYKKGIRISV